MRAAEYQDIGLYLRDSRESLRIPLAQAARALHIREKYLEAIESGTLEGLPGKAYIRGYIKNYVEYLRLDPVEVLEAYENLLAHKSQDFFIPETTLQENMPTRRVLAFSVAGLIGVWLYWDANLHDTTRLPAFTARMPEKFVQLLDKTELSAMDKAWKSCLTSDELPCFWELDRQSAIPASKERYGLDEHDTP